MFTVFVYRLKVSPLKTLQFFDIYLECESDIKMRKLALDRRVTDVCRLGPFETLEKARLKREQLVNDLD